MRGYFFLPRIFRSSSRSILSFARGVEALLAIKAVQADCISAHHQVFNPVFFE